MEEIILRHLNKERLSPAEESQLEHWLDSDEKNPKIFNQLKLNLKGASQEQLKGMKGEVWDDLSVRIQQPDSLNNKRNRSVAYLLKIAAIIILMIGMGTYSYLEYTDLPNTQQAERIILEKESLHGQKLTFTLPDGSTVKLNAGSKLSFPKEFDPNVREIHLIGEAFFDIKRNPNRPFHIITENLDVEVLGTTFNVKVYPDDNEMSVAVKTGKVRVDFSDGDSHFLLEPNEMVSYSQSDKIANKEVFNDSQLAFGWADKKLVYENANITQIFRDLSRWYGVEFEIERTLNYQKRISGRYDNPSLVDVMKSLSFAYEFEFSMNDKTVKIR